MELALMLALSVVAGAVGCVWFVIRGLVRAQGVFERTLLAQEHLHKAAMDRLMAIKDYQAYALVKQDENPGRKRERRPVHVVKL